jgi:hypothetical protein
VARQIGPLHTVETRKGLLLDQFFLISADGTRLRFGLLAGQLKSAGEGLAGSGLSHQKSSFNPN